ncbi:MAG: cytochrome c3 family protein [Geothrix sp.]|nr:cytochrome c3 family protein [Geothrix sp.]
MKRPQRHSAEDFNCLLVAGLNPQARPGRSWIHWASRIHPHGLFRHGSLLAGLLALLGTAGLLRGGGIGGSKHDLSTMTSPAASQVCMYCHTPHHANNTLSDIHAPLWNRVVNRTKVFTVYNSPSLTGAPGDPNRTVSVLCLGCHDGTLTSGTVYGLTRTDKHDLINGPGLGQTNYSPNCQRCHQSLFGGVERWKLGQDLSNDHPIAISFPANLSGRFRTPPDPVNGWPDARLYAGKVECPTCHTVHDPAIPPFLRKSNAGSALCLTCHLK